VINLDSAAAAPIHPKSFEYFDEVKETYFNSSSLHHGGAQALELLNLSRDLFYSILNAKKTFDLVFTSSATESNNLVIQGLELKPGDEVLYYPGCHPSMVAPLNVLKANGILCIPYETKSGVITQSSFEHVSHKTKLILISHLNNQSGVLQDIEGLCRFIKSSSSAHIHIDASQSFTKHEIDLQKIQCDSLTLSSHKIGALRGVSTLFAKKHSIQPILLGGGHEGGLRSSTVNVQLIYVFAKLSEFLLSEITESFVQVESLNHYFRNQISDYAKFLFPKDTCSPYILTVAIDKLESQDLIKELSDNNIYVSSTSACSSNRPKDSVAFQSLGIDDKYFKNIIRFSLNSSMNQDDMKLACKTLNKILGPL
jgi:cysteine desulfurase